MRSDRNLLICFWATASVGVILALLNLEWPIARNALDYAKAAVDVLEHHFALDAVVRDHTSTGGKPILFSLFAAPFVWLFNANTGVIIASSVGTVFFLWTVVLALPRLNRLNRLDSRLAPLELVFTTLNPLVIYQFWSAYPDSLLAGFVLLAFVLTDTIASRPEYDTRWHIAALGLVIFAAIHTKLYGAVLGLSCPAYLLMHGKSLYRHGAYVRSKLVLLCLVFGGLGALLVMAKLGHYPLLLLDPESAFQDYLFGLGGSEVKDLRDALLMMGFAAVLTFHVALLFLLRRAAWRAFAAAPTIFFCIYLIGLLPASGASYNMRYFIPAFPFLSTALAAGAMSLTPLLRRVLFGVYTVISVFLILDFNFAPVEQALWPMTKWVFGQELEADGLLDNLRLPTHIALKRQIDTINAKVPTGATLYWASDYYGTATHGLAHDLGVRGDLKVRYVLEPTDPPVSTEPVYLTEFTSTDPPKELWRYPHWANADALGEGLFRLDPIAVRVVSLSGDSVPDGQSIQLRTTVTRGQDLKVTTIQLFDTGKPIQMFSGESTESTLSGLSQGRHEFLARATYDGGLTAISSPTTVYVGARVQERIAGNTEDLSVEYRDGEIDITEDTLELDTSAHWIGIRFNDIVVPQGIRVASAHLRFIAASTQQRETKVSILGENSDNAAILQPKNGDLSRRPRTGAHVKWELTPWTLPAEAESSPNLAPILNEIFARNGWRSGNSVALLIQVTGAPRLVETYGHTRHGPPALDIELVRGDP